jgi:hypothetical protein
MKSLFILGVVGLLLVSCAPSTPLARIEQNPAAFSSLSKKHQGLVQQGQISAGMTRDAVMLAWGAPDQRFQGSQNSKATERWDYIGSRPVYTNQFYGGFGHGGFGRCGRYWHGGFSDFGYLGFGPEVAYLPYQEGSVIFINNRVDSWERLR